MDLAAFRSLLSPAGQEAIQAAEGLEPREVDFLAHYSQLSRRYPPELARAALETAILRREAQTKFPQAEKMYFTRPALEQATSSEVAFYRSVRYEPFERAADLGCSIGADTIGLAKQLPVVGLDLDPLRLAMARANLEAWDLGERASFVQADLAASLPFSAAPGTALFFDPARRHEGRRIYSVQDYHPPLSIVREWLPRWHAVGIKISPGVKLDELQDYQAEIEFISSGGELKEAVLWFGPLRTAARRATVLPGAHSLASDQPFSDRLPLSEPQAFLYEPDPSVLRAGLVAMLGQQLDASQLDPEIAYLTCGQYKATPFARAWQVEDWFPFQLKRLRTYLRQRGVGRVTVKKRGSPLEPERLARDLRLKGELERTLVLTQLQGRPIVIVCLPGPYLL
jgi:hypothetical protein